MGFGKGADIESYAINGDTITFTTNYRGYNIATITATRTAADVLAVTAVNGVVIDDIISAAFVPGIVLKGIS